MINLKKISIINFLIGFYIALGFSLSYFWGIEYTCTGTEMFPEYNANPFVFKKKSLGASMEYYYIIPGLILNLITWSIIVYTFNYFIKKVLKHFKKNQIIFVIYRLTIVFLFLNTSLHLFMVHIETNGSLNHFVSNWDYVQDAKDWGMICDGKWYFL